MADAIHQSKTDFLGSKDKSGRSARKNRLFLSI